MFIIGLMLTLFSLTVAINLFQALEKVRNHPYLYRLANGLTESQVETYAIIAVIAACIGICLMIFGWLKRRNKAKLTAIENRAKPTYCPNCKVNISTEGEQCPICGTKLERR